jgi:hypothetical protein
MKQDKAEIVFNKIAKFTKIYGDVTTADLLEMARNIPDPKRSAVMVKKLMSQYPELQVFKAFTGKFGVNTVFGKVRGIRRIIK